MDPVPGRLYLGKIKFCVKVVPYWDSRAEGVMDAEWIKSPTARRVLEHWADARPAWLWSGDGARLLWRNTAARQFHSKGKKRGPKFMPEAVPIRGQIARLIRLGSLNRSSLSRIQFLAGEKPVSATCACTPLQLPDDSQALLIVDVDPVSGDFLDAPFSYDAASEALFPPGTDYIVIDDDGHIAGGSQRALQRYVPFIESEGMPEGDGPDRDGAVVIDGVPLLMTRFKASPHEASLILLTPLAPAGDAPDRTVTAETEAVHTETDLAEPLLPIGAASRSEDFGVVGRALR